MHIVVHIYAKLQNFIQFLARDVIYTSRAYATMSVSICLSVTDVHCGRGACRKRGGVISSYASHC